MYDPSRYNAIYFGREPKFWSESMKMCGDKFRKTLNLIRSLHSSSHAIQLIWIYTAEWH